MEKDFSKTFTQCPNCGSTLRFCEELGKEVCERGLARPGWEYHFDVRHGAVYDPARSALLPIGITVPGYTIITDICMDCGTVYATKIERIEGTTRATPLSENDNPYTGKGNPRTN